MSGNNFFASYSVSRLAGQFDFFTEAEVRMTGHKWTVEELLSAEI